MQTAVLKSTLPDFARAGIWARAQRQAAKARRGSADTAERMADFMRQPF
ncbi:hypothetical protein [Acidovorax sp. NCPPB 3576]|nr:hypothetical protein [Acidovorax sp. NCPPB 3576]WCM86596.1 hypothetical protein M5C98_14540 [Acidovorax sp. NCPPB 3576]